jgi:hydrophobe/amphiphile efflux-3 (HAE3) family protein
METILQWSARVYQKPWPLMIITAAITLFLAMGIPLLQVDNDVKSMLPKNDKERMISDLYNSESNFGPSNAALIAIESPDIFNLQTLTYVKALKDELEELNKTLPAKQLAKLLKLSPEEGTTLLEGLRSVGINDLNYQDTLVKLLRSSEDLQKRFSWNKSFTDRIAAGVQKIPGQKLFAAYDNPLGKIQSLVNADYIAYEDDALVSKKLVDNEDLTPANLDGLKKRVASWDTYEGMLVSKDRSMTSVVAVLKTDDKDVKALFNTELMRITQNPPAGLKVYVAGEPVIEDHLGIAMAQDMPFLIPLVMVVIVVLLFFCFRTVQGIVFPLLNTIVAAIWTLGLMGYLGVALTTIGSTIPVLLMAIVSAYGIHQMNHYYEDRRLIKFKVLQHNAKSVGLAILLSGITVMIGFGALVTQDFIPIRDFGVFVAFGDLVGVLGALFLIPALLMIGKTQKKERPVLSEEEKTDLISKFLRLLRKVSQEHSKGLLIVTGIGILALTGGATLLKSDLNIVSFFAPEDSIRISDKVMDEKMAGTKSLTVILDSDTRPPLTRTGNAAIVELTSPEVLKTVDQFAADLKKKYPTVQKVNSFADVLKKMNQEMNGGDPAFYIIPDDPALISQYLMIFSGDTKNFLTANHDKLRIMITMNKGSTSEINEIALYSQAYFSKDFREKNHFQVQISGDQHIAYVANQTLLRGTLESIVICIVIVFLLLVLVLRNFWMSLIGIVPIFLCLVVDFGFLGFTGIELNTSTALVSSIGIGIGVDFSIHFITWYRRELQLDRDIVAALDRTIVHKGRAILYNLFVIVGGFLVLMGSKMMPMHDFGLLTAVCMSVTAFGALLVVPALLRLLAKKQYRFLYLGVTETNPRALEE